MIEKKELRTILFALSNARACKHPGGLCDSCRAAIEKAIATCKKLLANKEIKVK